MHVHQTQLKVDNLLHSYSEKHNFENINVNIYFNFRNTTSYFVKLTNKRLLILICNGSKSLATNNNCNLLSKVLVGTFNFILNTVLISQKNI